MKEAVEMIVKALVNEPEAVEVREVESERGAVMIEVRVAQTDVGKVIGRQGSTIRALRSVLHAAGLKRNQRFVLDILE
ncbi:MAG: KH domain-containing protein [Pyrinomonadaceae bacterium]